MSEQINARQFVRPSEQQESCRGLTKACTESFYGSSAKRFEVETRGLANATATLGAKALCGNGLRCILAGRVEPLPPEPGRQDDFEGPKTAGRAVLI
jgi:hypothetical protein